MSNIQTYSNGSTRLQRHPFIRLGIGILFLLLFSPKNVFCKSPFDYEEISVTLNVVKIGSQEMSALIADKTIYLPVKDLFDFLKIKNSHSVSRDSVEGYFINPQATYIIDKVHSKIIFQNKEFVLSANDLIRTENNLYLRADYFNTVFGLDCVFNFRSLSVVLNTKIELPAIRELQQETMRRNMIQIRGEKKADTIITKHFSLFHLGMADWSINTIRESDGNTNTRLSLGVGAMIAGGEANVYLNYTQGQLFNSIHQYYYWRYVNNDNSLLRQVTAGKIFTQTTSTLTGPVTGVQITNAPTTYRRSFGTYTLSNTTDPDWLVELYVNNVLINYVKADASGFYSFQVPVVYGYSVVKLKFYGPLGEERTKEEYITVPFNFIPQKQFEYTVTAGVVDDGTKSKFSRANLNYGISNHITVGGGMEYLSSVIQGKVMPYVTTSVRLGTHTLISAEHTYGVRSKGIISFRLPSNLQLDLNYIKYVKGQTAIRFNYLEEKKAVLSIPFRGKKFSSFSRFTYSELSLPKLKFHTAEFLLSSIFHGVSSNLTTYGMFTDPAHPFIYSNLSLTFRLHKGIRFTPQLQYEYRQKNVSMIKCEVEKNLFNKGFLNFTYEKYSSSNNQYYGIGLRYNFSFAQTSVYVRSADNNTFTTSTAARGSLIYNDKINELFLNNQSNVGKGGLTIIPFLDLNCNGIRDEGEPKRAGLKLRINGGRIEHSNKDTIIHISGLEAYTNYLIELSRENFDNIAWQLKNKSISVTIEPDHFKLIEIPVSVEGEASGTVLYKTDKGTNGLGRMIVNFYNKDSKLVARTVTESDGYFSYMGLAPGAYTVNIDSTQLDKLSLVSTTADLFINIKSTIEGDVAEGLRFVLQKKNTKL